MKTDVTKWHRFDDEKPPKSGKYLILVKNLKEDCFESKLDYYYKDNDVWGNLFPECYVIGWAYTLTSKDFYGQF